MFQPIVEEAGPAPSKTAAEQERFELADKRQEGEHIELSPPMSAWKGLW
jgi:hypothetical protein